MDLFLLGLAHVRTFGYQRLNRLLPRFGSAEALWRASKAQLTDAGVPERAAGQFIAERGSVQLSGLAERCNKHGIRFIGRDESDFPELLRHISDPPIGIFLKGKLYPSAFSIAVVGTRRPTAYGTQVTRQIAAELARNQTLVVSGLAMGIDGIAHAATLESGGATYAVLGSGLDEVFPAFHRQLAERIVSSGGALISEYSPGTPALKHHFPLRNRIIVGLSSGVVVTEAPEHSGALLTAFLALDYNRDVFAVPGPITSDVSRGCHKMLRHGAVLTESGADVLNHYQRTASEPLLPSAAPLTDTERMLLEHITREGITVDQLVKLSRLDTSVINSTLILLEMKGWVSSIDSVRFIRTQ